MNEFRPTDHSYWMDGIRVPSVTQVIASMGQKQYGYSEGARRLGQYVHETIDLWEKGELDMGSLDPILIPYLGRWESFRELSGYRSRGTEIILFHPHLHYAGKIDGLGWMGKSSSLLDLKTGAEAEWHIIQAAAYFELAQQLEDPPVKAFRLYLGREKFRFPEVRFKELHDGFNDFKEGLANIKGEVTK